ncbi:sugar phosphate isomerase/epimerase [Vibrio sp. SS-MA-C1-2]|uniref:sugar phosphate isomerase/epimerase family protein n=1 Tax=Vibrio sp. SS-MA-C1-2 TaxID=2908646 RepID=UPI001F1DDDA0|nr:sugar phosphate isomerase/epimerase family protein [Vibrio sp. SS-MA-C1-2]UJF18477.1 sugar phosphate isomerase/epimerase [Vibrio sp. SS-MA-C1-2]
MEKLAINTAIFDGYPMEVGLSIIAELGVKNVEFAFNQGYVSNRLNSYFTQQNADKLRKMASEFDLNISALGCTMNLGSDDAIEQFKRRIDFAAYLNIPYLNTCTGRLTDKVRIIDNLKILGAYAKSQGRLICLENGGDENYNLFTTLDDGLELLALINNSAVALNFDPGNVVSMSTELDPTSLGIESLPYCRHFHIKDTLFRDQEVYFVSVGNGEITYRDLIRKIKEKNLPYSLEIPLRMHRGTDALPIIEKKPINIDVIKSTLKKSVEYINTI